MGRQGKGDQIVGRDWKALHGNQRLRINLTGDSGVPSNSVLQTLLAMYRLIQETGVCRTSPTIQPISVTRYFEIYKHSFGEQESK